MDKNTSTDLSASTQVKLLAQSLEFTNTALERLTEKLDKQEDSYNLLKGQYELLKQAIDFLREEQAKRLQEAKEQADRKLAIITIIISAVGILIGAIVAK